MHSGQSGPMGKKENKSAFDRHHRNNGDTSMIRNALRDAQRRTSVRKKNISLKCRKQNEQHDEITTSIQRVNGDTIIARPHVIVRNSIRFPALHPRVGLPPSTSAALANCLPFRRRLAMSSLRSSSIFLNLPARLGECLHHRDPRPRLPTQPRP